MIPLTFLYDEYIDQPKLTEQKKPFEYIVTPPQVGRNNNPKSKVCISKAVHRTNRKILAWNGHDYQLLLLESIEN